MGGLSFWHILLVLVVILVLFGRGKIPQIMDDLGRGIRSFKSGMNADEKAEDKSDKTS